MQFIKIKGLCEKSDAHATRLQVDLGRNRIFVLRGMPVKLQLPPSAILPHPQTMQYSSLRSSITSVKTAFSSLDH